MHVWHRCISRPGLLDLQGLAEDVGWSRRHLTERFGREIGLPPRQFARVLRFQRSRRLLEQGRLETMTAVAAEAGYFDHAHMLHDWAGLAGCTPAAWMREELPSVQDSLGAGEAE
jgi:transcriptional regulator GlxA family with amidase domain